MKVLLCHSHLVWLVFEGSIPTCTRFCSECFSVACSCCFAVVVVFRNGRSEERLEGKMNGL